MKSTTWKIEETETMVKKKNQGIKGEIIKVKKKKKDTS